MRPQNKVKEDAEEGSVCTMPYTRGQDHTSAIKQMVGMISEDQGDHVNLIDLTRIPTHYQSIIGQSALFSGGVGSLHTCHQDHVCFTTIASRPHMPCESEIPVGEYTTWHDEVFGVRISEVAKKCGVESLPPHHVHWLMSKQDSCSWDELSRMPIEKASELISQYASQIMAGRNLIARQFDDRQILSTLSVGHAGPQQRAFNAQSLCTVHVHTVALPKEPVRPVGMLELNAEQEIMYRKKGYYCAVQKCEKHAQYMIDRSFSSISDCALSKIQHDDGAFGRTRIVIKPPRFGHITLEQVLLGVSNLNRDLGILWENLSGDFSRNCALSTDSLDEVMRVIRLGLSGAAQIYPLKPCFTVVVWWERDRIAKIEFAPALHGPAELTGGSIIKF